MSFVPNPILLSIGGISIHYYGLILVLAFIVSGIYSRKVLLNKSLLSKKKIEDLFFYLIIFGLLGARLFHVFFFEWEYYSMNIIDIIKIWNGGLAIQGAIISGLITLYIFCKKNKLNFFNISDNIVPFLALGQFIGRWGNYFNQELYGKPTNSWYGIFIELENRVLGYEHFNYFYPTFFYESILNLILFIILINILKIKKLGLATLSYLLGYSIIRFGLEYIRIDEAPLIFNIRAPQFLSLWIIVITLGIIYYKYFNDLPKDKK